MKNNTLRKMNVFYYGFLLMLRFLSILKTICMRCHHNISIGSNSILFFKSSIWVYDSGRVNVGNNSSIGKSKLFYHGGMPYYTTLFSEGTNSIISIGNCCRINGAYIHAKSEITIGNQCVCASGVSIIDSNGHCVYSNNRTIGTDSPSPIRIGNNVWIGINATILKGTVIGDNSIVSAGSVVKGIFPNNSLICGNPAYVVKKLDIKENVKQ